MRHTIAYDHSSKSPRRPQPRAHRAAHPGALAQYQRPDDKVLGSLDAMRVQPPDIERLRGLYAGWGFKSLLASLQSGEARQGSLW